MDEDVEAAASLIAATLARLILSNGREVVLEALALATSATFGLDLDLHSQENKVADNQNVSVTMLRNS